MFQMGGDLKPDDGSPAFGAKIFAELERARVPIDRGTLVVFSNYQLVHRVLRMELEAIDTPLAAAAAAGTGQPRRGHRDFLAFFVVDQRHPLQSTANRPVEFKTPLQARSARRRRMDDSEDEDENDEDGNDNDADAAPSQKSSPSREL